MYSEVIAFLAGMTLVYYVRPGWNVVFRRGGRWTWEVSRIPCKNCPLAQIKETDHE